jgi:hypothetical protein
VNQGDSALKLIYITGILLTSMAFNAPRQFALRVFGQARGGVQLEPGKMAPPARKHHRDLTVPRYFRGYNGPRDA